MYYSDFLEFVGVFLFLEGEFNIFKFLRSGFLLMVGGGYDLVIGKVVVYDVVIGSWVVEVGDEFDVVFGVDISFDYKLIVLGGL